MKKLIVAKHEDNVFEVFGEINKEDFFDSEFRVKVNGNPREEFGETFAGSKITAQHRGESIIRLYANNCTSADWLYVAPEVERLKAYVTFNLVGKNTPDTYLCDGGHKAHLIAHSDVRNYYVDNEGYELFVVTDKDNNIVTTYENFFVSAIVDDYHDERLKVVDSGIYSAEATTEWIKGYCE